MQIPMQALGVTHKIKNMFELDETKLRLALSLEEMSRVRILDKEGNPFFKVVEKLTKKLKTCRILKRKTVPFSEAKPKQKLKKRHRLDDGSNGEVLTKLIVVDSEHIDDHGGCDDQLDGQGVLYDSVETAQPNKR